jgi:hypothetical protein
MAFRLYPRAWETAMGENLPSAERLVLLAIVEHADNAGACYPSQERLAKFTGLIDRRRGRAG